MTPDLTTRIAAVRAACQKVLELDAAATPGPWTAWSNHVGTNDEWVNSRIAARTHKRLALVRSQHEDASFIAHSRTFSPAFARAVLVALDIMENEYKRAVHAEIIKWRERRLTAICDAFPEELPTP